MSGSGITFRLLRSVASLVPVSKSPTIPGSHGPGSGSSGSSRHAGVVAWGAVRRDVRRASGAVKNLGGKEGTSWLTGRYTLCRTATGGPTAGRAHLGSARFPDQGRGASRGPGNGAPREDRAPHPQQGRPDRQPQQLRQRSLSAGRLRFRRRFRGLGGRAGTSSTPERGERRSPCHAAGRCRRIAKSSAGPNVARGGAGSAAPQPQRPA